VAQGRRRPAERGGVMDYTALAVILAAIVVGSFAKGLTGIGLPLIAIPTVGAFIGMEKAIVTMTIPVFISNVWIVWGYRRLFTNIPGLKLALAVAAVGTVIGTAILVIITERMLITLMACWVGLYLINVWLNPGWRLQGKAAKYGSPVFALLGGISQGATGIAGPPVAIWMHSFRFTGEAFVFGVSIMFLVIAGTHLISVSGAGLMDTTRLVNGAIAAIPTIIFVELGMRTTKKISPKLFNRIILAFVVTMECRLIYKAFFY
jgi:uncharacterized membrane protein YfcA